MKPTLPWRNCPVCNARFAGAVCPICKTDHRTNVDAFVAWTVIPMGIAVMVMLTGCEPVDSASVDQCMRREIFAHCMKALPVGPATTKYNDWAEVVSECETVAYYQAKRRASQIKPECMP